MPWIKAKHDCPVPDPKYLRARFVMHPATWECPQCGAQHELILRNTGLSGFLNESFLSWQRKSDGRDMATILNDEDNAVDH